MEFISSTVKSLNGFMWDFLLLFLLVGTGIWFTIRLRGVQLRYIGKALKTTFGNFDLKGEAAGADGMSSSQAVTTAIAAQVGTGNLAGAATAIATGGPVYYIRAAYKGKLGKILYSLFAVFIILALGCTMDVDLVWAIADMFNSFMVIPILLGLLAMSGVASKLLKEFEAIEAKKNNK